MDETTKRDLLVKEYLHLQSTIESFDQRALTVKAWSVTASLAGLGAAFAAHSEVVFLIATISSLMFWILEASWKTFQLAYYPRNEVLEAYFAGERSDVVPMQIARSWYLTWKAGGKKRLWSVMWWPHVFTPHLFVTAAGVVLYTLSDRLLN